MKLLILFLCFLGLAFADPKPVQLPLMVPCLGEGVSSEGCSNVFSKGVMVFVYDDAPEAGDFYKVQITLVREFGGATQVQLRSEIAKPLVSGNGWKSTPIAAFVFDSQGWRVLEIALTPLAPQKTYNYREPE